MYAKVVFGLTAIFGESTYTSSLLTAASSLASRYGFGEVTFENGTSALSLWQGDDKAFYSDKTNQLIIAAAF